MTAVFRRELSSYLKGVSGYVFGAFLIFFAGIYCMVYNLQYAYTNFEYVLGSMSYVFLIIVPVLTMRVLAEERRQKTDQLLYSLPLSMAKVVLGKYAAMLVIFLIPLAVISCYPLLLSAYGNVHLPNVYSAMLGFFLLGAALIAIGMYVSSATESQAVAAGLCFVVMLLNYFAADLASFVSTSASASLSAILVAALVIAVIVRLMTKNTLASLITAAVLILGTVIWYMADAAAFEGLFSKLLENLSLFERFYGFIDGALDLTSVVYFISITGVLLFLCVQSMEKRRWSE